MLKKLRISQGYTPRILAKKLGVPTYRIYQWEGGYSSPELANQILLAAFFNITVIELQELCGYKQHNAWDAILALTLSQLMGVM